MTRKKWVLSVAFSALLCVPFISQLRAADIGPDRAVISRVEPEYPDIAKRAHISGTVKVEAVIAPNGTVRSAKVLGGNPTLGQAAREAILRWKYAPAPNESTLIVVFTFKS